MPESIDSKVARVLAGRFLQCEVRRLEDQISAAIQCYEGRAPAEVWRKRASRIIAAAREILRANQEPDTPQLIDFERWLQNEQKDESVKAGYRPTSLSPKS